MTESCWLTTCRKSITMSTVAKVRQFLKDRQRPLNETHFELPQRKSALINPVEQPPLKSAKLNKLILLNLQKSGRSRGESPKRQFRFYDNRQKYLLFVNTCSEKWAAAGGNGARTYTSKLPALRIFDAGMGDGTVLTNVMRQMHRAFPIFPFHIVGKEISLEDVRLGLEKMPDRFPRTSRNCTRCHQPLLHGGAWAGAAFHGGCGCLELDWYPLWNVSCLS